MIVQLNRICLHAYALSMSLGLLVLLLVPLHRGGTHYRDVIETFPDRTVAIAPGPADGVEVGDRLQVYRFNHDWTAPVGHVEVVELGTDRWIARFDPQEFAWPMGRQGKVLSADDRTVEVNLGTAVGLAAGNRLQLFDGPERVGVAQITAPGPTRSTATLLHYVGRPDPTGLTASEFVFPNQVAWFHSPWLQALDALLLGALLGFWSWSLVSSRPGELWMAGCGALRARIARIGPDGRRRILLAASVAVVLVMGQILWYTGTRIAGGITAWAHAAGMAVTAWPLYPPWGAGPSVAVLGVIFAVVFLRGGNPLAAWRELVAYAPQTRGLFAVLPRGLLNWFLHLFVFYAFGSTLTGFLAGNMTHVAAVAWPGAGLDFWSVQGVVDGLGHMLTHAPQPRDARAAFEGIRSGLASVTIAGCLLGYGHTVASILWKRDAIRNIDFTPWGWLVNAICYGPLLGDTIYVTTQHPFPLQPVVTDGIFFWMSQVSSVLLNAMYTLSILNLGTMFGVMVDKGVRRSGFYSVIRHPNYTFEPLMFMVGIATNLSTLGAWGAAMAFPIKYWLRSERDDQFMGASNPEYLEYREQVPWKFVPGLY